jgi:hypothetical protein
MYASERAEVQAAYQIDPSDPDIQHAWRHTVNPANDIQRIEDSLATMNNLDSEIRQKAQASANSMMPLLSENSQTCQSAPTTTPVTLPLIPAYENVKQISGYKLAVDFPKGKAKLTVDTLHPVFISAGHWPRPITFNTQKAHLPNTVQVDNFQIGPLQFRNCMVGVSDTPFPDGVEGLIGTDAGIPHLKLMPEGGPQCSAMLTSEEHGVHLGTGTEFILTMQSMPE